MFQVSRVMLLNKTLDILMIILRLNIGWIFHLKIISTEIVREECALLYTLTHMYLITHSIHSAHWVVFHYEGTGCVFNHHGHPSIPSWALYNILALGPLP